MHPCLLLVYMLLMKYVHMVISGVHIINVHAVGAVCSILIADYATVLV